MLVVTSSDINYAQDDEHIGKIALWGMFLVIFLVPFYKSLADTYGRKRSPVVVGLSYGLFIGGLWSVSDLLYLIIPGESTPTQLSGVPKPATFSLVKRTFSPGSLPCRKAP